MRFSALFILWLFAASRSTAQISFTNRAHLLSPDKHYSGVAMAVLDMDGDGRDDIVRMNQGYFVSIAYQNAPGENFTTRPLQAVATESQWGMCAGDVDNNGYPDILTGGFYDNVKILMASNDGTDFQLVQLTQPETFTQCVNFADINHDGWLDAFVCHDDGPSRIFGNNGNGNFIYQPGWINLTTVPPSDDSGNYGSVWSDVDNDGDLDLYIAKCRQGVNSPNDGRRINQLFLNNGDGTYTQDTTNTSGLRIGAQSWTADFGDIDNDGDFDCFLTNHDVKSQLLLNDGNGHFTDISLAGGIEAVGGLPIQGVFRDFDNDGYVDILVAGTNHYLLRNNADLTFTVASGLFDNNQIESFAIGDLNHDGFQDIYGGYANIYTDPSDIPDALWMNNGNGNNFFGLNLRGVQSNRSAVGAKVKLYSPLGLQVREVRAGESYGIMNSMQIHFGMGNLTSVDSVEVQWPSGIVDRLYDLPVNQYLNLQEGGCLTPTIQIEALGSTTFCTGDSAALSAPPGYAYAWSNGDTTAIAYVFSAGSYQVTVTTPDGCSAVSNQIRIVTDPVEIPTIAIAGDTLFCAGGSVELTSSPAGAYAWSNGAATQSITVANSGSYAVTTQGLCASFESAPVTIVVLEPADPQVTPDTTWLLGSATLQAEGDSIIWLDMPGGNIIGAGNTLLTPPLNASTTYWAQNLIVVDQPDVFTGQINHQGTTASGNQFNGALIFDCFAPVRLSTVKVYASAAGQRRIVLIKDGLAIQSKTINIPVGATTINLDFNIPVGTDLQLTTDAAVNQNSFGTLSPQLLRSDLGIAFPYTVPGVLSIKTTNFGPSRYYYFYNWQLDFYETRCAGDPVAVTAVVDSALVNTGDPSGGDTDFSVFPNPTRGVFVVTCASTSGLPGYLRVRNSQGKQIREYEAPASPASKQFQVDMSDQPAGVYFLEWSHPSGRRQKKIIVE